MMPSTPPSSHSGAYEEAVCSEKIVHANSQGPCELCLSIACSFAGAETTSSTNLATSNNTNCCFDGEAEHDATCPEQINPADHYGRCELCLSIASPYIDIDTLFQTHGDFASNGDHNTDDENRDENLYWSENDGTWGPSWLQPAVLSTFAVLFSAASIGLFAMLHISLKNNRLGVGQESENELRFEGCELPLPGPGDIDTIDRVDQDHLWNAQRFLAHWGSHSSLAIPTSCVGLSDNTNKYLYFAARFERPPEDSSSPVLKSLSAVLCYSGSWISRVKVIDNAGVPVVLSPPSEVRHPVTTNLWDLIDTSTPFGGWNASRINWVTGPVQTAYNFFDILPSPNVDEMDVSLYTNEVLYQSTMNMSRILGPWIAHYRLRQSIDQPANFSNATGTWTITVHGLTVNKWVCLSMATFFGLFGLMLALTIFTSGRITKIWTHAEGALRVAPRFEDTATQWGTCSFAPLVLKFWARTTVTIYFVVIGLGLCVGLRLSETPQGIATFSPENHIQLWASAPSLVVLSITMYINSCDTAYRGLAMLSKLSKKTCRAAEIDVSFLDMFGLQVLYRSLRVQVGVATLTQVFTILGVFLTTIAPSIPNIGSSVDSSTFPIQQKTWLGPGRTADGEDRWADWYARVNILAAKLNSTCREVPPSNYDLTGLRMRNNAANNSFNVSPQITEYFTCPNGSTAQLHQNLGVANADGSVQDLPWRTSFDIPNIDNQFENTSDGDHGAIPDVFLNDSRIGWLDSWFGTLVQPNGRFHVDAFGDSKLKEEILEDIHHLYGFLAAQLANVENRFEVTQSSRGMPPPSLPNLTAIISTYNRKIILDSWPAHIMIGILAVTVIYNIYTLVASAMGSARGKQMALNLNVKGLAPDGFNSIAAMTALLKDSNAMDHLPEGAEHMSKKELHEKLSGLQFRMGWFWRESTQTRHYTIGVLDDENFEFLGDKDDIAREDALLRHPPE
ncbi:hypothetical protein CSIM01_06068 [Colletotrichum simmondsii]|uniref:Uncharacterized protein n=1 Tax=Colletotrichum simmondsii TaxID=703756 RepID=A0A135SSV8_9PEZI|nr:hypothetical protein CSIM01_06068 [Colletotrichum simmondsii]